MLFLPASAPSDTNPDVDEDDTYIVSEVPGEEQMGDTIIVHSATKGVSTTPSGNPSPSNDIDADMVFENRPPATRKPRYSPALTCSEGLQRTCPS